MTKERQMIKNQPKIVKPLHTNQSKGSYFVGNDKGPQKRDSFKHTNNPLPGKRTLKKDQQPNVKDSNF